MPFLSTTEKMVNLGGGLRLVVGTWTGSVGDADGTYTVQGSRLYFYAFFNHTSGGSFQFSPCREVAGAASGTIDINVSNNLAVTTGRFIVLTA